MKQKIGVWGLGIVGKAAIRYLHQHGHTIEVTDKRIPTQEELLFLEHHKTSFVPSDALPSFLERNEYIIPSPGINLTPYSAYEQKWLPELDIFYEHWKKPIIAITGTVGKTSVVHLLSRILESFNYEYVTGGNIGIGMLDLLNIREKVQGALLEVSSFQLEKCKAFAPDFAIWTNFYPNHLDRHGSLDEYFKAKCHLLMYQKPYQKALIPWSLKDKVAPYKEHETTFHFFTQTEPLEKELVNIKGAVYFFQNEHIVVYKDSMIKKLIKIHQLPSLSYPANWLIICAVLDILEIPLEICSSMTSLSLPDHRLRCIGIIKGITFYNDSKATIIEATRAAVNQCQGRPINLFLGGISKGVDRRNLITDIKNKVVRIFCFGAEAESLYNECLIQGISAYMHATLEESFKACIKYAKKDDIVLFSPSGASYDLFAHYEKRGEKFVTLVKEFEEGCINE